MKHPQFAPEPVLRRLAVLTAALLLGAVVWSQWPATAAALSGREVMEMVRDRDDGDNQTSDMEMVLIDREGNRRVRQMRQFRKDFGEDTYSLIFFLAPADVKGTGFLTYDYDASGKDDDQWLYLPALRKTKRIASSDKSGSFMGSDFNYSDMTTPDLDDFNYTLTKEPEVDGHKTWQVEAIPKSEDVMEETGYEKSWVWVRQDNHVLVRAIRWVHNSRRIKYMQVKELEQINDIWVGTELQMATREGRDTVHATVLRLHDVKFNQDLSEDLFTVRRLEKGL